MSIRFDPSPSWVPDTRLHVPFYNEFNSRLFVISYWAASNIRVQALDILVPSSTLLTQLNTINSGDKRTQFCWEEWGPDGTRMMDWLGHSYIWVCYVFGTKFVDSRSDEEGTIIEVYDFNLSAFNWAFQNNPGPQEEIDFVCEETILDSQSIGKFAYFDVDVRTTLPYVKRSYVLPNKGQNAIDAVMCTEDNIILVGVRIHPFLCLYYGLCSM
jgi:hypothetical protein